MEAADQTKHQRPDIQLTLVKCPLPKSQLEQFLEDEVKSQSIIMPADSPTPDDRSSIQDYC